MRGGCIRGILQRTRKLAYSAMEPPKYVDASRVKKVLKYEDLIPVIEEALVNFSAGESGGVVQPVRSSVQIEDRGHILVMPAFSAKDDGLAVKLVSRFYENEKQDCSSLFSNIMVLDSRNGFLKAIMDGIVITEMRTAAASAVATKHLASKDAGILCILGSGLQAQSHAQVLKLVRDFKEIRVWSRTFANAQKFADEIGAKACSTVEQAASGADVIVTLATTPILSGKWVKPGALIE